MCYCEVRRGSHKGVKLFSNIKCAIVRSRSGEILCTMKKVCLVSFEVFGVCLEKTEMGPECEVLFLIMKCGHIQRGLKLVQKVGYMFVFQV